MSKRKNNLSASNQNSAASEQKPATASTSPINGKIQKANLFLRNVRVLIRKCKEKDDFDEIEAMIERSTLLAELRKELENVAEERR